MRKSAESDVIQKEKKIKGLIKRSSSGDMQNKVGPVIGQRDRERDKEREKNREKDEKRKLLKRSDSDRSNSSSKAVKDHQLTKAQQVFIHKFENNELDKESIDERAFVHHAGDTNNSNNNNTNTLVNNNARATISRSNSKTSKKPKILSRQNSKERINHRVNPLEDNAREILKLEENMKFASLASEQLIAKQDDQPLFGQQTLPRKPRHKTRADASAQEQNITNPLNNDLSNKFNYQNSNNCSVIQVSDEKNTSNLESYDSVGVHNGHRVRHHRKSRDRERSRSRERLQMQKQNQQHQSNTFGSKENISNRRHTKQQREIEHNSNSEFREDRVPEKRHRKSRKHGEPFQNSKHHR